MWKTIERPGYLGKHKQERYTQWDLIYGNGNWRLMWEWTNKDLDFEHACMIYEEAYFIYLRDNNNILVELLSEASNVYEDSLTNIESGQDYMAQETHRTHIQDISIRRVVQRLGRKFEGDKLIQIRHNLGEHRLSMTLSPGVVLFHKVEKIKKPWLVGWWNPGTVECFYQSNRVLQIRKS